MQREQFLKTKLWAKEGKLVVVIVLQGYSRGKGDSVSNCFGFGYCFLKLLCTIECHTLMQLQLQTWRNVNVIVRILILSNTRLNIARLVIEI